jgi:hypothetical protein
MIHIIFRSRRVNTHLQATFSLTSKHLVLKILPWLFVSKHFNNIPSKSKGKTCKEKVAAYFNVKWWYLKHLCQGYRSQGRHLKPGPLHTKERLSAVWPKCSTQHRISFVKKQVVRIGDEWNWFTIVWNSAFWITLCRTTWFWTAGLFDLLPFIPLPGPPTFLPHFQRIFTFLHHYTGNKNNIKFIISLCPFLWYSRIHDTVTRIGWRAWMTHELTGWNFYPSVRPVHTTCWNRLQAF